MTTEQLATLLEEIAEGIAAGDMSAELLVSISAAETGLLKLQHTQGIHLLSRLGLLLATENGTVLMDSPWVRQKVHALTPLDPARDRSALCALANEIRQGQP